MESKVENKNYMFDDWRNDTSYMYRIHNTCIECELVDSLKIALAMYRLEE